MTDLGNLRVTITADAAQLEREMGRARTLVQQGAGVMTSSFGGLKSQLLSLAPALSAVAFVQFGKNAIDAAGRMVDLSDRIGFAASTLSALEGSLVASGSNLDEFSAAVNRMNNLLGEAAKGNEEAIKAFDGLGLSVNKLRTLSPEEQFYEIAGALGQIKDQSKQTEAGMNIFGRGFAALLPMLKEYEGDMRKAVAAQEKLGDTLDSDTLKRIDAFGDSLSAAGLRIRNAFLEAFGAILKVVDKISEGDFGLPDNASYTRPDSVMAVTRDPRAIGDALRARNLGGSRSAGGANTGLLGRKEAEAASKKLAEARITLDEYNRSLERQNTILQQTPREQAALEAGYKTIDLAQKAGIKDASAMIEANEELARTNYDLAESMQEAARFQQILHDKLSQTLTDIAFRADSASDSMIAFADSIAQAAFQKRVAGPLADALIGTGGSKGLLDDAIGGIGNFFGGYFANGGSPPVGIPSIVGERGPEIFVPGTSGTIIPNNKLGGTTVIVQQTIQLSPGVPELINARIREAAPIIAAQAQAATLQAMRQGGDASRIIGARS